MPTDIPEPTKDSTRGGRREGAGRPLSGNVTYCVRLDPRILKRLNAAIPVSQRSRFLEDAIKKELPFVDEWLAQPSPPTRKRRRRHVKPKEVAQLQEVTDASH